MDELHKLQARNEKLKDLLREGYDGISLAVVVSWACTYFVAIFILWWGFSQKRIALAIIGTWIFEFLVRRLYAWIEKQREQVDRCS